MRNRIELEILPQPNDAACGPTCLHSVYSYYGDAVPLSLLLREVQGLATGGTLAVHLARHALRRGYRARIYTYNLELFDPTWFSREGVDLRQRLEEQARHKRKLRDATDGYLEFLALGGEVRFEELGASLLQRYLSRGRPMLCGLSATYLYGCTREIGHEVLVPDDVRGRPAGHFVVLCGLDEAHARVELADPLQDNPPFHSHRYSVGYDRLIGAILLGVITHDANLLVLEPESAGDAPA